MEWTLKNGKVVLLTTDEALEYGKDTPFFSKLDKNIRGHRIHFSKAEMFTDCVVGTLLVPKGNVFRQSRISMGYYMSTDALVFVDDAGHIDSVKKIMDEIEDGASGSVAGFFHHMLEYFIKDDMESLQNIEAMVYHMEEEMLEKKWNADVTPVILHYRKLLLGLSFYYQQLADVSQVLAENYTGFFSEEEMLLFRSFGKRVDRLYNQAQMLREYVSQIRELHQQQMDIRQNDTMRMLTIVTTIFLPLTLITGWYGMNFVNMPELKSPYGYFIVIGVCVIAVIGEFMFFKKKKMFR